jgi:hypothetical protein
MLRPEILNDSRAISGGSLYIFDTNVFITLGYYYRKRFPTIWARMDTLADGGELISVREVRRELDLLCSSDHVNEWIDRYRQIFLIPSSYECEIVANILRTEQYRGLVRRKNIIRSSPVADPFLIGMGCGEGRKTPVFRPGM